MPDHDRYDIIIVGAGPAGCAAAYDLARAGRRVLLLDRRSFPRAKACACGLTRKTLAALRYPVDPVIERICHEIVLQKSAEPAITNLTTNPATNPGAPSMTVSSSWVGLHGAEQATLPLATKSAEVRVRTRNPICAMAVRSRFDDFCLQQTLAAGPVTLRKIDTLTALRETVDGIELDIAFITSDGPQTETLTALALIGADGSNGQTRRLEAALHPQAPIWYTHGFALEATIPHTALPATLPQHDAPDDLIFDFAPIPGGYGWLFPKGDHINIGVGAFAPAPPHSNLKPETSNLDQDTFSPATRESPEAKLKLITRTLLADYCAQKLGISLADFPAATVTGQHLGMGGHLYTPRGRVLLTGDAAGLVDPLTGEGIHSAIVSGQAAAAAVLESLPATTSSSRPKSALLADAAERPAVPAPNPGAALMTAPPSWVGPHDAALAAAYARHLAPLQQTLAFSHRAAQAFYKQPERGFKAMRLPILRSLILKTYADGLPRLRLLTLLAKFV